MRFHCGRGYTQTVLSIIQAKLSTRSFIPSRLVSTWCTVPQSPECFNVLLSAFGQLQFRTLFGEERSKHSFKCYTHNNVLLRALVSKTNGLRWLHTLKASTAMSKLVHLPYSTQGLVCADLCHLDGFLYYCFLGWENEKKLLLFFFTRLAIFIHAFSCVSCMRGYSHRKHFLHSTALLFHWCISILYVNIR